MERALAFAAVGLMIGSFLTVVVHRLPAKVSVVGGRSMCPSCGSAIRARDNVPVASWLLLRGRCRSCEATIPAAYPLTELATAALFVGASLAFRRTIAAATMAALFGILLAAAAIDVRHRIIPNRLVLPGALVLAGLVAAGDATGAGMSVVSAGLGLLAFGGGLLVVNLISPSGMGMGDVKLAGVIGLALGAVALRDVAVAAGMAILAGGLAAVGSLLAGRSRKRHFPFGPFLSFGAIVAAFLGPQISHFYLHLFR